MGIDESEVSRVLRGDVPSDDPVWGEVSSFLNNVGTAYPAVPTTALEGRHLAAVARESRLVQSELQHHRRSAVKRLFQGSHRVLAGSVGALLVLTAGIGVASALGITPLGQLIAPPPSASSVGPQATSQKSSMDPADGTKSGEPGTGSPQTVPGSIPTPTVRPTSEKTPGSVGDEHKNPRATEKANNRATPTHKPKPKPTEKSPGKPTKTTPPGKAKNG